MPTEYKIEISDEGGKYLQKALDDQNDYQRRATLPEFTMESYLQWTIDKAFGISKEAISVRERQEQLDTISGKLVALPTASLTTIAKAIDDEAAKVP